MYLPGFYKISLQGSEPSKILVRIRPIKTEINEMNWKSFHKRKTDQIQFLHSSEDPRKSLSIPIGMEC